MNTDQNYGGQDLAEQTPHSSAKLPDIANTFINNPLRCGSYRNKPCLCGSGRKVKVCCGVSVKTPYLLGRFFECVIKRDKDQAEHYSKLWAQQVNEARQAVSEQRL